MTHSLRLRADARRGVALVIVLLLLSMVAIVGSSLLKRAALARREQALREREAQVEWLLVSAQRRAAAQLRIDPAYRGETWEVPAGALGGRGRGTVTIAVEPGEPPAHSLRVQAAYPSDRPRPARRTRQFTLSLPPSRTGAHRS